MPPTRPCGRMPARTLPAAALLSCLVAGPALADRVSVLVFDASGSMWNRVEGDLSRIEVARDVMADFFARRDASVPLSVIAYGHNRRGDCGDIEVIAPMGTASPGTLESRLRALMPRGMTPLTDSLALARDQIPPTAEAADIILVTDGLETCEGDPCALAAALAAEGIEIRAHVVGFGLTRTEVEALSCITHQTGGMLFETNSGAELAEALQQVSAPAPEPEPVPEWQPAPPEAAFDIGDKAEAGFTYSIHWNGDAASTDYLGFVPQGADSAPASPGFGPITVMEGGVARNPVTRTAPTEPGLYDLIISSGLHGIIARQAVEVVGPAMGFEAIGSVEAGTRVPFTFRGPEQIGERLVIADPDQPVSDFGRHDWGFALHRNGSLSLRVPTEPGVYEIRYLNGAASEIMFSRRFGVGVPFEDADATTSADLAAAAAAATRGDEAQDAIPLVPVTFRLPLSGPAPGAVSWEALPLDPDMPPEAWAPHETGPVVSGELDPGRWLVRAVAAGEMEWQAKVEIFPGRDNDHTLQLVADTVDASLEGMWIVWAIPPREIDEPPQEMIRFDLRMTEERQDFTGTYTAHPAMTGKPVPGALQSVVIEQEVLRITYLLPQISPDPITVAVIPDGDGFTGQMIATGGAIPVALWREGTPADLDLWQDRAFGPAAE